LRGGVLLYAAQGHPKIDAEIAEKRRFRTGTSLGREPRPSALDCLSPLRGLLVFGMPFLGLTPQAKYLSLLRSSNRGVTPEKLHKVSSSVSPREMRAVR